MSGESNAGVDASIVLNVMGLRELATRGFRSWLLQDIPRPYELILNLFNDARPMFDRLLDGINPICRLLIKEYKPPEYFNTSAANNLGLHVSSGAYVLFANADIIYPSHFLRRALAELARRDIRFAIASRVNLNPQQTIALRAAESYSRQNPFDLSLDGLERLADQSVWPALSPWMIRRDAAFELGGFDPRIIMAEDRDFMERGLHYLRRKGLQETLFSFCDLHGYHQYHTSTGLLDTMPQSKAIREPRRKILDADPNSTEDVIGTPLGDFDALLRNLYDTKKPPMLNQYRKDWRGKLSRRGRRVWDALVRGN
jgi:hypothetical protein